MAGTPVASPQVSSTVGLKNVVIAPLVTDTDAEHTYDSADQMKKAILNAVAAGTAKYSPSRFSGRHLQEAFEQFIRDDVRGILILKYQSGVHRRFAGYPHVGMPSGLRLTYAGHEPPRKIQINDEDVFFSAQDGFIDLSLIEIYQNSTWPVQMNIAAHYQQARFFEWNLSFNNPTRHWEWFKRPDWT